MKKIIYSCPHVIGSYGLGSTSYQQILALYEAGMLLKVFCKGNELAHDNPISPYLDIIPEENEYKFDIKAKDKLEEIMGKRLSAHRTAKIEREEFMNIGFHGIRSLTQQKYLEDYCNYFFGKIFKDARSTYPLHQFGVMEREKILQSIDFGIPVQSLDTAILRYSIFECEKADHILCSSNYVKETFLNAGYPPEKLDILHLGVDTEYFKPNKIEHDTFTIGFTATNWMRKGLMYLLNEFKRMLLDYPKIKLIIKCDSITQNIPNPNIEFISEPIPNMNDFYNRCDITILPTVEEGCALTVLESLACGVPVITTKFAGSSELMTDGKEGFIYNDPIECVKGLHNIYESRHNLEMLGKNARKTAEKNDWKYYRKKYAKWIEDK